MKTYNFSDGDKVAFKNVHIDSHNTVFGTGTVVGCASEILGNDMYIILCDDAKNSGIKSEYYPFSSFICSERQLEKL
jgi:hypothetical protein